MKMITMERVDLKLYNGQINGLLCVLLIHGQINPSQEMSDHKHILNLACAPHPMKLDIDACLLLWTTY